jgi:hypothetical protein
MASQNQWPIHYLAIVEILCFTRTLTINDKTNHFTLCASILRVSMTPKNTKINGNGNREGIHVQYMNYHTPLHPKPKNYILDETMYRVDKPLLDQNKPGFAVLVEYWEQIKSNQTLHLSN